MPTQISGIKNLLRRNVHDGLNDAGILSISQLPATHATSNGGLDDGLNDAGILSISNFLLRMLRLHVGRHQTSKVTDTEYAQSKLTDTEYKAAMRRLS